MELIVTDAPRNDGAARPVCVLGWSEVELLPGLGFIEYISVACSLYGKLCGSV
jgi:hypothetical protein